MVEHVREERFGGLTVWLTGGADRRGGGDGPLVVLMHGFGAPGTDLVGLWRVLSVPREVRFAFPEAPHEIPGMLGARAWWMLDLMNAERALASGPKSYANEVPPGMKEATDSVVAMLGELGKALGVPQQRMVVGGFSQGSMAACDATFTRDVSPRGLIVLSGTPVNLSGWAAGMRKKPQPTVFQSHGEQDPLLSFAAAEQLRNTMVDHGLNVQWARFRGGHELPGPVIDALGSFISNLFSDEGGPR